MDNSTNSAVISKCGRFRYRLDQVIDPANDLRIVWIMLNPSTADATIDDPTIRRVRGFTASMGAGAFTVVNLFALRSTDPKQLLTAVDPVGPDCDRHICEALEGAGGVVCAWGANVPAGQRSRINAVMRLIGRCGHIPLALGVTKGGEPRHPLYVAGSCAPVRWVNTKNGH